MKPLIFIRPGHGGTDPGAVGPGRLAEDDAALLLAERLKVRLEESYRVQLARVEDVTLPLEVGVAMAERAKASLFVSLHFNAANNPKAHGTETLYHPRSVKGGRLAGCVQKRLAAALGLVDRGAVPRPGLLELRATSMPAVIVETAFISNPEEAARIRNTAFLDTAAGAIAAGIREYLEGQS